MNAAFNLTLVLLLLLVASCGSKTSQVSVNIQISGANFLPADSPRPSKRSAPYQLPATASGFDCLLVNVMGDGIANRRLNDETGATMAEILAGSACVYPGVVSDYIPMPQGTNKLTVNLPVPVGTNRVVQVMGVISTDGCAGSFNTQINDGSAGDHFFAILELGRAIVDTRNSTTVQISNSYDSATPREATCEGKRRLVDCSKHSSDSPFAGGAGTLNDPYAICTQAQLANVSTAPGAYYYLGNSISLSGGWTPLGTVGTPFSGKFDGRSWQISNLSYSGSSSNVGLFGAVSGEVRNITVSGAISISSGSPTSIGMLAGQSSGIVLNAHSSGTVNGGTNGGNVGGLVGYVSAGRVSDSTSSATVSGNYGIGGLVGFIDGTITPSASIDSSSSSAAVTATGSMAGGLVAGVSNGAFVTNSYASLPSAIAASDNLGGFVGEITNSGGVTNCYVTGPANGVPSLSNSGAFAGWKVSAGPYSSVYSVSGLSAGTTGNGDDGIILSAPQMLDAANFASIFSGFDFNSVWLPPTGSQPPLLR